MATLVICDICGKELIGGRTIEGHVINTSMSDLYTVNFSDQIKIKFKISYLGSIPVAKDVCKPCIEKAWLSCISSKL